MRKETRIATDIAIRAGKLLARRFGELRTGEIRWKTGHEPVTQVDEDSNNLIVRTIQRAFPSHHILSEELARISFEDRAHTWIIDPLDGTNNFIARIPMFGVSIALAKGQEIVMGVIYAPLTRELFVAEKGKGAFLNGKRMHVSSRTLIERGMLLAGRGYTHKEKARHRKIIYELEMRTTYFRRLGSAALMLAYVADGRADGTLLTGDKPWDTGAGALLVTESGGKISDYCGKRWSLESQDIVATNGKIHKELVDVTCRV